MAEGFIPPHGGYQQLLSYRKAEIVYDATVYFCARFLDKRDRTYDHPEPQNASHQAEPDKLVCHPLWIVFL